MVRNGTWSGGRRESYGTIFGPETVSDGTHVIGEGRGKPFQMDRPPNSTRVGIMVFATFAQA